MAKYDETPVARGTSRRWEVLMSDDDPAQARRPYRRCARDVRAEHRVLGGFSDAELASIPLVPEGARLSRREGYLDLHDPARAEFIAEGDEVVEHGQHVVARKAVAADLWGRLRRACDGVLGRRSAQRLRAAV